MVDIQQLQILAQLTDNIEQMISSLEKAYQKKDIASYNEINRQILDTQRKISEILR